jgi:glycosyltransferase involved in cell wall biosynthesis
MSPRLSVGLPVYNGADFLQQALDSLLGQTFGDFELIISDNASTDGTTDICREWARADRRVRYIRQPRNIGATGNHNAVAAEATGELFKWAAHDDRYAPDLLQSCVTALDHRPDVVAAHAWTATIGDDGEIRERIRYTLSTASPEPAERFRSMLFDVGGDDAYAVVRADVMRRVLPYGSYYRADRTIVAALALHGPFYQVPDWLFFRRDHPDRATRTTTVRSWCATMDPQRADRWRHPMPRLLAEYLGGYLTALRTAPLTAAERRACYAQLGRWVLSRSWPHRLRKQSEPRPEVVPWPPSTPAEGLVLGGSE